MPTKRSDPRLIIAVVVLVLAGLLAFRFLMPANCSALFHDAQYVAIGVSENANVDGEPKISFYELDLEPGDLALIELKNLFTEYNCFYTMKKADGFVVEDARFSFMINTTDGTKPTGSFIISGKYLISGSSVWRVGLTAQKAEELQLRLFDFVMEHQETADE